MRLRRRKDENEDGLLSLPAEEDAGEAEKMKMVSSLYLQRKRLVRRLARLRRRKNMKKVSSLYMQRRGW